ncbi:hypothetical protein [Prevotella sp. HUN102]|uniref:hypothetical protein n=1 Tax=Prevotella sp. HUN102 TaxID=1392486 RepID=UPI00048FC883|nr:hypothetical protein [Prevotella sp. HUN102]
MKKLNKDFLHGLFTSIIILGMIYGCNIYFSLQERKQRKEWHKQKDKRREKMKKYREALQKQRDSIRVSKSMMRNLLIAQLEILSYMNKPY